MVGNRRVGSLMMASWTASCRSRGQLLGGSCLLAVSGKYCGYRCLLAVSGKYCKYYFLPHL